MHPRTKFRTARVAAVICLGLAISVGTAAGAGVLDQSQNDVSAGYEAMPAPSFWLAQTFTAGLTGNLGRVDLFLARNGSPGDLTVQIRSTSGGTPSDTILATATVSQSSLPLDGYPAWVTVMFG